jgi:hypothetical protein
VNSVSGSVGGGATVGLAVKNRERGILSSSIVKGH